MVNPEDIRLVLKVDSNDLVEAYLSERMTIDGSFEDALHLKNLADALRCRRLLDAFESPFFLFVLG